MPAKQDSSRWSSSISSRRNNCSKDTFSSSSDCRKSSSRPSGSSWPDSGPPAHAEWGDEREIPAMPCEHPVIAASAKRLSRWEAFVAHFPVLPLCQPQVVSLADQTAFYRSPLVAHEWVKRHRKAPLPG